MDWQKLSQEIAGKLSGNPALADERPIIYVDSRQQQLLLVDIEAENSCSYPVSTAANGMGNLRDSFKTPLGIHRIKQKIRCRMFRFSQ